MDSRAYNRATKLREERGSQLKGSPVGGKKNRKNRREGMSATVACKSDRRFGLWAKNEKRVLD